VTSIGGCYECCVCLLLTYIFFRSFGVKVLILHIFLSVMRKRVIVLAFSFILLLGFMSTVEAFSISDFWDGLTNPNVAGHASKDSDDGDSGDSSDSDDAKESKKDEEESAKEKEKDEEESAKEKEKDEEESEKDEKESAKEKEKDEKESAKEKEKDEKESAKEYKKVTKTKETYIFLDENQERVQVEVKIETKTKDGETYQKIKIGKVEAVTDLEFKEGTDKKVRAKLSNGQDKEIKIMPNTASKIALSKLRSQNRTLELKEVGEGNDLSVVYFSEANKTVKFLGLFKLRYKLNAMIDSETGEVLELKDSPWWSFLAGEPLEEDEIEDEGLQLIKIIEDITITKKQRRDN